MDKKKKNVLIVGANSDVGTNVEHWLLQSADFFHVDTIDSQNYEWKKADFTQYDVVFHVAGIAHVSTKKSMEPLYYKVNRDLTIEVANWAKDHGVKQFIFMSSMIVYQESQKLRKTVITSDTKPQPNGFYGDSKLQAEAGLLALRSETFKVVILRPPMIYGKEFKGNFTKLINLSMLTPAFPNYHNKRSMLYIDNLGEFIKQAILRELDGIYYPQNKELADTVEIVRWFAKAAHHKIWISKIFNICVIIGAPFIRQIPKMFATYYYDPNMSIMGFEYQVISQEESFAKIFNNKGE